MPMDSNAKAGADGNQPDNTTLPPSYDLGAMLKDNPRLYRISQIYQAETSYLGLRLHATVALETISQRIAILCVNAVDFAIRPANPALLMGGPLLEFYEDHEMLQSVSRTIPNTDGLKTWDPSIKFALLKIDQSYAIAQCFELSIENKNIFGESPGGSEERKQRDLNVLKRAMDWMDQFRLPEKARPIRKSPHTSLGSLSMPIRD